MGYEKTEWVDHIVDPSGEIIQDGTRFTAKRMNKIEKGIEDAHTRLDKQETDVLKLIVFMELDGRAPGNNGIFADAFNGTPNKLVLQNVRTVLTAPRAAGTTVMNVETTEGFEVFSQVTIYDGTNTEDVTVTAKTENTITVQALKKDYAKGSVIARSNAMVRGGQLVGGTWGNYDVSLVEVV